MMGWFMNLLPKKKIYISEVEWEKERQRKRLAAEEAALGLTGANQGEDADETEDTLINGEYAVLEREISPERYACPNCGSITWEGVETCSCCGKELN